MPDWHRLNYTPSAFLEKQLLFYVSALCTSVYHMSVRHPRRALDPLEVKDQTVVSHPVGAEN